MTDLIYQWIDLIWLPITFFAVHKRLRVKSLIFTVMCIFTMRTQIAIMDSIGYGESGILGIMDSSLYHRGLVSYGLVIVLFLILTYFSPRIKAEVFLAAMLSEYILAVCGTMLLFVL